MLSLIETILSTEPGSAFTLVYGNRTVASIMFLERLEELKNTYIDRLRLIHVLSDEPQEVDLLSGLLDASRCGELMRTALAGETVDEAFVCGPAPMMDAAEAALRAAGVPQERIHVDRKSVV